MWLRLTSAGQLSLRGAPLAPTSQVSLAEDLNLVGVPVSAPTQVASALQSIAGKYLAVFGFSGGPQGQFLSYVPDAPSSVNTLTQLEPGKGYWIVMSEPAVLGIGSPPPSPTPAASASATATPVATAPSSPAGGFGP